MKPTTRAPDAPRIPKEVRIGPYRYSVVLDKQAINQTRAEMKSDVAGACDFTKQIITIDPDQHADGVAEVLLHEVMHAIQNTVGIGSKERIVAHEMIYRTAPVTLAVLRDNPELVRFLCDQADHA